METYTKNRDNFIFNPENYNILIVDDSKSANFIIKSTFNKLNYNCFCAFSLSQAKEFISKEKIDYIILDINLPDGDGFEVVKQLEDSDIKIFVLTSESDTQFRDISYQKGVIDFIEKKNNFLYRVNQLHSSIKQLEYNKYKTILVIDDSFVIQQQLKSLLENRNYNVELADDASIAWEIISHTSIDLILLDLNLRDSNGLEFLVENRFYIVDQKRIPVFIISGEVNSNIIRDGLKAGAIDVLSKPYVAEEVLLKVDSWIDYRQKETDIIVSQQLLEQYKLTVDRSAIVSKADKNGKITYVNDEFCVIYGYSKNEVIGKSHNILKYPSTTIETFKSLWHTIKDLKKPWKGEFKNRSKDGSSYWANIIINPILNSKDEVIEYIAIRNDITQQKKSELEVREAHINIKDSIKYASLIQEAILPENDILSKFFKDSFIIWTPKDTVGGDIYLFNELRDENECLLMFIDCTGHGVPGAFVTMLVKAVETQILAKILNDNSIDVSPAWIMGYFNKSLKKLLKQETKYSQSNVGWDGGIIYYNKNSKILKFAGAETPLFYIDKDEQFNTIKGNRYSVGYKKCDSDYKYKESIIEVEEGMKFYCTTDGYLDQNGGEKDFPFSKKRFGNIIKENYSKPMKEQKDIFLLEMDRYEKAIENNERNDDMTVISFEI